MIKSILENSITSLESEKSIAIQEAKVIATNEKITPFNAEIDDAYQKALNELAAKFESDKKALFEAGEEKKLQNQEIVLNEVVNAVSYKYDLAVTEVKKQIEKLGE